MQLIDKDVTTAEDVFRVLCLISYAGWLSFIPARYMITLAVRVLSGVSGLREERR